MTENALQQIRLIYQWLTTGQYLPLYVAGYSWPTTTLCIAVVTDLQHPS